MKFLCVVFAMTATCMSVNAQYYASVSKAPVSSINSLQVRPPKIQYDPKPSGLRMRNTGRTLTILGSIMLVGGVIMAASADELYYQSNYSSSGSYSEGDPRGAFGVVLAVAGTGMAIPGIIFWNKGSKRYNKYLEEQRASLSIKGAGLALLYQF